MSKELRCSHCDLIAVSLKKVKIIKLGKAKRHTLCRYCWKDLKKNNKFTREKVTHNYESADLYVNKQDRIHHANKRIEVKRI